MKRTIALVLASTLGTLALLLGIVVGGPAQSAQALCDSSLDCNPANLPLLVEAGIASGAPAGAAAGAAATTTVATGGVAALTPQAAGIVGVVGLIGGAGASVAGILTSGGVPSGTQIQTQPQTVPGTDYTGWQCAYDDHTVCVQWTGSYNFSGWKNCMSSTVANLYPSTSTWRVYYRVGTSSLSASAFPFTASGQTIAQVDSGWASRSVSGTCNGSQLMAGSFPVAPGEVWIGKATEVSNWQAYPTFGGSTTTGGAYVYSGTVRTTVHCTGPGIDAPVSVSQHVNVTSGQNIPVPEVDCPAGDLASTALVEFLPDGSSTWQTLVSGAAPDAVQALVNTYTDCFGPGVAPCKVDLQHQGGDGQWETCGTLAVYCPDWVAQAQDDATKYRCKYGSTVLDLSYCSMYRKAGTLLPNVTPGTESDPTIIPITAPAPDPLPNQITNPDGSTGSVPASASDGDPSDQACWPSGWGDLNPLSWVLMPIKCALQWAFVPDPDVVDADVSDMQTAWDDTPPGKIRGIIASWQFANPGSGCQGITIDMSWLFPDHSAHSITIMQACPGDTLASLAQWSRIFGDLVFGVLGALAITRYIAGIVQFGGLGSGGEA